MRNPFSPHLLFPLLSFSLALSLAACAAGPLDDSALAPGEPQPDDSSSPDGKADGLTLAPLCKPMTTWIKGQGYAALQPASTYVCALTSVSGAFNADGNLVDVNVDSYTGNWALSATWTGAIAPAASATCWPKSCFLAAGGDRWNSGEFAARDSKPTTVYASATAWWGDAVTFVTGVGGAWTTINDFVRADNVADPTSPNTLIVQGDGSAPLWGSAHSFYAGDSSSPAPARFWPSGDPSAPYVFSASSLDGGDVVMAPTSRAMCVFTALGGQMFSGYGSASIFAGYDANGNAAWILRAVSSDQTISAEARCFLYDQR
jgi:hypothetical protein